MRKAIIQYREVCAVQKSIVPVAEAGEGRAPSLGWLNLEEVAAVELTSEDSRYPFENALRTGSAEGWRASSEGPQRIRLRFSHPVTIRRIRLEFRENERERSQEIALFATAGAVPRRELLRQQWTFSPGGSTSEVEEYVFELNDVTVLELEIDPGRHDKQAVASLQILQIG